MKYRKTIQFAKFLNLLQVWPLDALHCHFKTTIALWYYTRFDKDIRALFSPRYLSLVQREKYILILHSIKETSALRKAEWPEHAVIILSMAP